MDSKDEYEDRSTYIKNLVDTCSLILAHRTYIIRVNHGSLRFKNTIGDLSLF